MAVMARKRRVGSESVVGVSVPDDMVPRTRKQLAACLASKSWRMNNLYTIVDEGGNKVPFRQREVQRRFESERHGLDVVLKSRQHGLSSEIDIDMLDDCLFTPDLQCGIIAQTKADAAEIFSTKIELPYTELPETIRKFNPAVELDRTHIKFANGSSIRVAVSFRSATTHRLHISEMGKICAKYPARAEEIKTGTLPSVHPQLGGRVTIESTAEGASGDFYDLCQAAQAQTAAADRLGEPLSPLAYRFHFFAWWQDPKNAIDPRGVVIADDLVRYFAELAEKHEIRTTAEQQAWYAIKRDGSGGLGSKMKREHPSTQEEAFEQSVEGAVYANEIDEARKDGRIRALNPHAGVKVYTAWDLGYGDATCVWFFQAVRDQIYVFDYYEQTGRGAAYHAGQVLGRQYAYDFANKWCLMPHDVKQHDKGSGLMLKDIYQGAGLSVQVTERPNIKADGIEAVRSIFNRFHFDVKRCDAGLKRLAYYRFDWNEDAQCFSKEPIHDMASHAADALQSLALGYKLGTIGGEYIGDSKTVAAYHAGGNASPYSSWNRFNRGKDRVA